MFFVLLPKSHQKLRRFEKYTVFNDFFKKNIWGNAGWLKWTHIWFYINFYFFSFFKMKKSQIAWKNRILICITRYKALQGTRNNNLCVVIISETENWAFWRCESQPMCTFQWIFLLLCVLCLRCFYVEAQSSNTFSSDAQSEWSFCVCNLKYFETACFWEYAANNA